MPHLERSNLHEILADTVNPVLEELASDDEARARSVDRFDRDDPMTHQSPTHEAATHETAISESLASTEMEPRDYDLRALYGEDYVAPPDLKELPSCAIRLMHPPLTDDECTLTSRTMSGLFDPESVFSRNQTFEILRIERYMESHGRKKFDSNSDFYVSIIARRNIRRLWEKLGIWNPHWGVRELESGLSRIFNRTWKWPWQHEESPRYDHNTVAGVLRQRQDLHRGEHRPPEPHSSLKPNASAAEAESFLFSRPWALLKIEDGEEGRRIARLHEGLRLRLIYSSQWQVSKWWLERGHPYPSDMWIEWGSPKLSGSFAWKWSHESPPPSPESLSHIDHMDQSPLDAKDMEFTLAEVDALKNPPPKYNLKFLDRRYKLRPGVGRVSDTTVEQAHGAVESTQTPSNLGSASQGEQDEPDAGAGRPAALSFPVQAPPPFPLVPGKSRAPVGPELLASETGTGKVYNGKPTFSEPRERRSRRKRPASPSERCSQPLHGEPTAEQEERREHEVQQPRRSQRLIGMKRQAEPSVSVAASSKKSKRGQDASPLPQDDSHRLNRQLKQEIESEDAQRETPEQQPKPEGRAER